MRPGEAWIRKRVADAPQRLLEQMIEALPADAESDADALAAGAVSLYRTVVDGPGGRAAALPLLAADALLTHAFEACAEVEPAALESFAARWGGAGRLGELG